MTEQSWITVHDGVGGKFAQHITVGAHTLVADEPAAAGGSDTGPAPYDLLLAALGACTSMTLRMYADRKQIALERVVVRLRHGKIYAKDCEECEIKEGKIDRIDREIELHGDLNDAEIDRLMYIADKCPVHQTLTRENQIVTRRVV